MQKITYNKNLPVVTMSEKMAFDLKAEGVMVLTCCLDLDHEPDFTKLIGRVLLALSGNEEETPIPGEDQQTLMVSAESDLVFVRCQSVRLRTFRDVGLVDAGLIGVEVMDLEGCKFFTVDIGSGMKICSTDYRRSYLDKLRLEGMGHLWDENPDCAIVDLVPSSFDEYLEDQKNAL